MSFAKLQLVKGVTGSACGSDGISWDGWTTKLRFFYGESERNPSSFIIFSFLICAWANFYDSILTNCIHFLLSLPQSQSCTKQSNTYKTPTKTTHLIRQIDPRRKNPGEKPACNPVRMPVVDKGASQKDVISPLLQDRIILLDQGIEDEIANVLVAQLLYLANEDPTKDITFYINSPGGGGSVGMAIYDTMQYVPCDVSTVCFGIAASMSAFLLRGPARRGRGGRCPMPGS